MEFLASSESTQTTAEHVSSTASVPALPGEGDRCDKVEAATDIPKAIESTVKRKGEASKPNVTDDMGMEKVSGVHLRMSLEAKLTNPDRAAKHNEMQEFMKKELLRLVKITSARWVESGISELNEQIFGRLHGLAPFPLDVAHEWKWKSDIFLGALLFWMEKASEGSSDVEVRCDTAKHLPLRKQLDSEILRTMEAFHILEGEVTFGETVRVKEGGFSSEVVEALLWTQTQMTRFLQLSNRVNCDVLKEMQVPQVFIDAVPKRARMLLQNTLWEGLRKRPVFSIIRYMQDETKDDLASAELFVAKLEKIRVIWDGKLKPRSFLNQVRGFFTKRNNALSRCMLAIDEIKQAFPQMSHTELDKQKIDMCTNIILAGLEAYSRALKSRCLTVCLESLLKRFFQ